MRISDWSSDVCSSDLRHRFLDRVRGDVEIAGAQAHLDPARLAFDREARGARHHRRERLRAAHAAQPGGQQPFARQVAAMMLAPHLDERLVCALRSEERTSELQSLMRNSYAVCCLKQNKQYNNWTR